jgi:hypothetical protein
MQAISSFCAPAILYFIIAFISLFLQYNFTDKFTFGIFAHIVFIIIWTFILYFLCRSNWSSLAWTLVAIPFITGYFILKLIFENAVKDPSILSNLDKVIQNPNSLIFYSTPKP